MSEDQEIDLENFTINSIKDKYEVNPCFNTRVRKSIIRSNTLLRKTYRHSFKNKVKRCVFYSKILIVLLCVTSMIFDIPFAYDSEHRIHFFLNVYRKTLALFQSTLPAVVGSISSLSVAYVVLIMTVYWNIDSQYGRKWSFVSSNFYDINKNSNLRIRNMLLIKLWKDAFNLKVWGDPVFKPHIVLALKRAVERKYVCKMEECNGIAICKHNREDIKGIYSKLRDGEFEKFEILNILMEHAGTLKPEIDKRLNDSLVSERMSKESLDYNIRKISSSIENISRRT